jgi:hypothetical protein
MLSEDGESKKRWKARKTVAIIQAASGSGCYSIVTIRHRTFQIIYTTVATYVSVQVAEAARIADRSFLADPTSSSVIAPICLTASKSLEPTRAHEHTRLVIPKPTSPARIVSCPTLILTPCAWLCALESRGGPFADSCRRDRR